MRLALPAAACLLAALLAGCVSPAMFGRGAFSLDDWDTWTGWNDAYGSSELKGGDLYYHLTARQDDTRDEPADGYLPGLIRSRDLDGERWRVDAEADFRLPPGHMKRVSLGVWAGADGARPSIGNPDGLLKLVVQRQNGPRPEHDSFIAVALPGGSPVALPKKAKVLRFERSGAVFSLSYSLDRKKFTEALRADASALASLPAQKFFLGGFAGGDPQGAHARLKSFRLNGSELLK